jgi:hypothetical protein
VAARPASAYSAAMPPRIEIVRQPFALPPPPEGPFVVLDVAFAGGNATDRTLTFIEAAGERLRLWVDHHEHALAWPRFSADPRFVLVPSRIAHACPELVTREVVARAGEVETVLAHHDFDGLMSAVRFLRGGEEPYPGADEDARAADSPGRGHTLSPRGNRLSNALSEAGGELEEPEFATFYRAVAQSLLDDRESDPLARQIDRLALDAEAVHVRAATLASARLVEAPGVCVLRLEAQLDGRLRRAVLSILEDTAPVGLVLEGTPKRYWATAATYHDTIALDDAPDIDRGRHDFRFGPTKDATKLIAKLSSLARDAGLT